MNASANSTGSPTPIADRLVPLGTAQAHLGVSRSQLYRMIEAGTVPRPVKVGRRTYFSDRELQDWIAARLESRQTGGAQ